MTLGLAVFVHFPSETRSQSFKDFPGVYHLERKKKVKRKLSEAVSGQLAIFLYQYIQTARRENSHWELGLNHIRVVGEGLQDPVDWKLIAYTSWLLPNIPIDHRSFKGNQIMGANNYLLGSVLPPYLTLSVCPSLIIFFCTARLHTAMRWFFIIVMVIIVLVEKSLIVDQKAQFL